MRSGDTSGSADAVVEPPAWFREQANVTDEAVYEAFATEWPDCWERAGALLSWEAPPRAVFEGGGEASDRAPEPPFAWFPGGETNAAANCLDRHLPERKNQLALVWADQFGERWTATYLELAREVEALAAGLRELGVEADDVVTLYLPTVPELTVAMLACARLGAVHNVVFAEYDAAALTERMARTGSTCLFTCDGYYRDGGAVARKNTADNARFAVEQDVDVVVVDRLGDDCHIGPDDYCYDDLVERGRGETVDPVTRAATDPLFRIYTSGTSGRPKAVEHTIGGYLAHVAWTSRAVLDLEPADTHFCTADVGWITGHSYGVYGPLALGATTVQYNGPPEGPTPWELIERYAVDVFYTTPTSVRSFRNGEGHYAEHDRSSLRLLGTVGEPITEDTWRWFRERVGRGECPIVDTWWQTETGAILLSTLPGIDAMRPGSVGKALPGTEVSVVDADDRPRATGERGALVVSRPWPGMPTELLRGERWGAPADAGPWRYRPEDSARIDAEGYVTVLGRVDDAVNVAGRRFSTMELEASVASVENVAEAAVVGADDETAGTAIYAYVPPARSCDDARLRDRIEAAVTEVIGGLGPIEIVLTPALPKTESGKVMRRLLTAVANDEDLGDTSALHNPEVVGLLRSDRE